MYDYHAQLERVVDGDTVRMTVDHGMYLRSSQSIRLLGVMAPELSEPFGPETRDFVRDWFSTHQAHDLHTWPFHLVTQKDKQTFNRYVGIIECRVCSVALNVEVAGFIASVST